MSDSCAAAVSITIFVVANRGSLRSRAQTSSPLISGRLTSRKISSGRIASAWARAVSPSRASITTMRSSSSVRRMRSITCGSSSAIRTVSMTIVQGKRDASAGPSRRRGVSTRVPHGRPARRAARPRGWATGARRGSGRGGLLLHLGGALLLCWIVIWWRAGKSLAGAAGGHQSRESSLERLERPHVVDFFVGATGESPLRTLLGPFGPRPVDLRGALGGVGEHDDLVVSHLGEAFRHDHVVLVAPDPVHELADTERREERGVAGQHSEVTLPAGDDDLVDRLGRHQARWGGDLEREAVGHR